MGNKNDHISTIYSNNILEFLKNIHLDIPASTEVNVLNPYLNKAIFNYCEKFYKKYYNDSNQRTLLVGINPGRFGGGLTGIPFTDPIKLQELCGIENDLPKRAEMSGDFIYKMIDTYGGIRPFYSRFYFSSICPLGFTHKGKNLNYYDLKWLQESIRCFIAHTMQQQLQFGLNNRVAFCLGMGHNYNFLCALNRQYHFFKKIVPLPHPRFIMQYRRKRITEYLREYITNLNAQHV